MATSVEMLSGRKKKDWEAETAAESLEAQAATLGTASAAATEELATGNEEAPATEPIPAETVAA